MTRLICFAGIDGSGKTSHIERLIIRLNKFGVHCQRVQCGAAIRFTTFPFFILCRLLGYTQQYAENCKHLHTSRFPTVLRNRALSKLWPYLVFIDMFILTFIRIKLKLIRGITVFLDRGLHDVLVETMVAIGDYGLYKTRIAGLLLRLVEPDLVIMLDVDEAKVLTRKTDIPNLEFVTTRRKRYKHIVSHLQMTVVNANKPFNEVHKDVKQLCQPYFNLL